MATHSSILAWRIPQIEEPGELRSTGSQRVRQDLATKTTARKEKRTHPPQQSTPSRPLWESEITSENCELQRDPPRRKNSTGEWENSFTFYPMLRTSAQSLSRVQLSATPWTAAHQASPTITDSQEFTQTHVHWVSDAIQPSHPLSPPSPPAFNLSQDQGLFQRVSSSHQVAKVLEF